MTDFLTAEPVPGIAIDRLCHEVFVVAFRLLYVMIVMTIKGCSYQNRRFLQNWIRMDML